MNKTQFHFIAIGGIGMSGCAKYLLKKGYKVSGSDIEDNKYLKPLAEMGAKIFIGHDEKNIEDNENLIVVVSTAIHPDNVELKKAKALGLKIFHRSDLLSYIASEFQKKEHKNDKLPIFFGFSGTHGKTTTSGLCSYILSKAKQNSSFIVGGIVPEFNTNALYNGDDYFVAELDESDGTIVKYSPNISVINNLELDHIDFYKDGLASLFETFDIYISGLKENSVVILNKDNKNTMELLKRHNDKNLKFVTFSLNDKTADYYADEINYIDLGSKFNVYKNGQYLGIIEMNIPGEHNVYNALAVISALMKAEFNFNDISNYFSSFTGMGRRFQKAAEFNNIIVIDDYGHHPTEICSTLKSVSLSKRRKIAIFQPHRYTRLQGLWNEFIECFKNNNIDLLVVTDVYAASEDEIENINSQKFVEDFKNHSNIESIYVSGSIKEASKNILPNLKPNDLVLTFGAGDITKMGSYLEENYTNLAKKIR